VQLRQSRKLAKVAWQQNGAAMQGSVDLVMICGRRPSLLAQTLASFGEKVFAHFRFAKVIANIDPFMGDDAAGDECAALLRAAFADVQIMRPQTAGFAAAVQRVWRATSAEFVFHLEDDWTAKDPITPQPFFDLMQPDDVQAVTLVCATKHTRGLPHQTSRRITRGPRGYIIEDRLINAFSTSPGMFKGPFLRKAADLLDLRFDPEKQFYKQLNPALEALALPNRCMFLRGTNQREAIVDIGREYRDQVGLAKLLLDGQAIWQPAPAQPVSEG
jgi:hypothetical protein